VYWYITSKTQYQTTVPATSIRILLQYLSTKQSLFNLCQCQVFILPLVVTMITIDVLSTANFFFDLFKFHVLFHSLSPLDGLNLNHATWGLSCHGQARIGQQMMTLQEYR